MKDLRTATLSSEKIERVGSVVWATDNKTLFFTTEDPVSKRSDKFWRHVVGAERNDLVLDERDELFDLAAGRSLDKKVLFVGSYTKTSREIRYLRADDPTGPFKVVVPREQGHEYDVDHYEGKFYITTNKGAKNFKVVTAPMDDPTEKHWSPFIPHNPAIKIDGLSFFKDHLVVSERERGLNYLRVIEMGHRVNTGETRKHIRGGRTGLRPTRPITRWGWARTRSSTPLPSATPTNRWSRPPRSTNTT